MTAHAASQLATSANGRDKRLAPHTFATIFPTVDGSELHALAEDIRQHGLREPITLYQEKILDGRARYDACIRSRVEPRFREYEGDSALEFVISANLRRRHLNTAQRTMIAAKVEGFRHGGDRRSAVQAENLQLDREAAAKLLNVSSRSVASAAIVRDHGIPQLQHAVLQGKVAVSSAAAFAQQDPLLQQRWLEDNILDVRRAVRAFQHRRTPRGPYEDLLASITATQKLMRHSVTEIVASIPDERRHSMAIVAERLKAFFTGLDDEMRKGIAPVDDLHQIRALLARARKSSGRTDRATIIQAVLPQLTVAQLEIVRSGKLGRPASIAAHRWKK